MEFDVCMPAWQCADTIEESQWHTKWFLMVLMYYSCKGRFTSDDIHNQTTPPKTKTIKTDKQNEELNNPQENY